VERKRISWVKKKKKKRVKKGYQTCQAYVAAVWGKGACGKRRGAIVRKKRTQTQNKDGKITTPASPHLYRSPGKKTAQNRLQKRPDVRKK